MRAGPGQTAVVEHEDLIRVADGGHALRDQHDRGLPRQMRQRLAKRGVGGKVQRGGAVVEDEDGGPPHQCAGDRQPLALAAGEIAPAGLDFRVQPALLAADDLVGLRVLQRLPEVFIAGLGIAPAEIVADGAGEEQRLLRHDADRGPQRLQPQLPHVFAAHKDLSLRRVVKPRDEVRQRGFARAGAADDADGLPGRGGEADTAERVRARAGIAERDAAELQRRAAAAVRQGVLPVGHAGLRLQHLRDPARAGDGFCDVQDQVGELDELDQDLRHVVIQRDQLALRDDARVHADAAGL